MALEEKILKQFLSVSHEIMHQFRNHYGKVNLTFPQAMALSLLDAEGPMPISALAERMGSANSTISGVIDRLEKMQMVERKRSEMDRRVIYVEITDHYRKVRSKTSASVGSYFGTMVTNLTEEEQQTVLRGLELLEGVLKDNSDQASSECDS